VPTTRIWSTGTIVEVKGIEELPLAGVVTPHHRPLPSMITLKRRNHASMPTSTAFCNKIGNKPAGWRSMKLK
jgi:hypothetical protein